MSHTKFQISNNFFHWSTPEWIFFNFDLSKEWLLKVKVHAARKIRKNLKNLTNYEIWKIVRISVKGAGNKVWIYINLIINLKKSGESWRGTHEN